MHNCWLTFINPFSHSDPYKSISYCEDDMKFYFYSSINLHIQNPGYNFDILEFLSNTNLSGTRY